MTQVLTLGLDGAAWHKLDRLIDAGKLPNLARLVDEGARADLQSVTPPVTCPAWRCSTSGKNPGKLGVYWWLNLDRETGTLESPDARSFETKDVWDYLSDEGLRSAIVNLPMTYPPQPLDGLLVSGFGAPFEVDLDESLTYPPEKHQWLDETYDWQIGVEDVSTEQGLEETYALIESRLELLHDLLDGGEYDYVHLTVFYINMLQHKYGDGHETENAWKLIDRHLGKLDDDLLKIVYSDHGHSTIENTFVVNKYLIDNGYLSFEQQASDSVSGGLYSLLNALSLSPNRVAGIARRVLPESVYEQLVTSGYPVPTSELADRIDWSESTALALSQGPVYLNRERLGTRYETVRRELATELEALRVDGEPVLEAVHTTEEVYSGEYLDRAPDLLLVPAEGWELYGGVTPSTFETRVTSWTSGNHPRGMLLMHGDDVAASQVEERSLVDIMPTVLRYLGCPVPTDVDGHAITEPFTSNLGERVERQPLESTSDRQDSSNGEMKQRLEDLGYLE